jgi:hypothetical protein
MYCLKTTVIMYTSHSANIYSAKILSHMVKKKSLSLKDMFVVTDTSVTLKEMCIVSGT